VLASGEVIGKVAVSNPLLDPIHNVVPTIAKHNELMTECGIRCRLLPTRTLCGSRSDVGHVTPYKKMNTSEG
jgi:hypothetical protein